MSKSNTFENQYLQLIFNNVDIPNIGDAGGIQNSAVAGNLYLALHTADPGEAGDQTTNECAYTSYDRVAVARTVKSCPVYEKVTLNNFKACVESSKTSFCVIFPSTS